MNGFFPATTRALKNITNIFDVVYPLNVGLWNLRCSIKGVKTEIPDVDSEFLINKFAAGSGISGFNPNTDIFSKSWEEAQEDISWILLILLFSVFESWLARLEEDRIIPTTQYFNKKVSFSKGLQFPKSCAKELTEHTKNPYHVLLCCFYPAYTKQGKRSIKYNYAKLDNMLYCYRVFKEMRNCYAHNLKIANETAENAYIEYKNNIITPHDLKTKETPIVFPIKDGDAIKPSLRGVIGFSQILQCLMITIDAELIKGAYTKKWFEDTITTHPRFKELLANKQKKITAQKAKSLTRAFGFRFDISSPNDFACFLENLRSGQSV